MIPDRLLGWWMASVAGTAAVLLFSPRSTGGNQLSAAASKLARALADVLDAALARRTHRGPARRRDGGQSRPARELQLDPLPPDRVGGDRSGAGQLHRAPRVVHVADHGRRPRAARPHFGAAPSTASSSQASSSVLRETASLLATATHVPTWMSSNAAASPPSHSSRSWIRRTPIHRRLPGSRRRSRSTRTRSPSRSSAIAFEAMVASRLADPEWLEARRRRWYDRVERRGPDRSAGVERRHRRAHPRERTVGVVRQQPQGRRGARRGRGHRRWASPSSTASGSCSEPFRFFAPTRRRPAPRRYARSPAPRSDS